MARIRVFDPACGSGNFLVIAYKEMRGIEAEINAAAGRADWAAQRYPADQLPRHRAARLPGRDRAAGAIIAEFQCDVLYRGQKEALARVPAADAENWISLRQCAAAGLAEHLPADGTGVKHRGDDLLADAA